MPELATSSSDVVFSYSTLRNISSEQDSQQNRKVLTGQAPLQSFVDIPTNENVREYLVEAEGKKRRQMTQVHRAMLETLLKNPEDFSVLNGGIVIVARDSAHSQADNRLTLVEPSIVNGSQTQGVLNHFRELCEKAGDPIPEVYVKYEILITDSDELIADTSIARNTQNSVRPVSIAGQKGLLDDLEKSLVDAGQELKLRKSETDWARTLTTDPEEARFIYTERLIQVMTALVPGELWFKPQESDDPNKVYTYSQKTKCLRDYAKLAEDARDDDPQNPEEHERAKALYEFFIDIAPQAVNLYEHWKEHQGFVGHRLSNVERDGRQIKAVPEGMLFPILAAYSAFVVNTPDGWKIDPPDSFEEDELITAAVSVFRDVAGSNYNTMGKSKACYSQLYRITKIYRRLAVPAA